MYAIRSYYAQKVMARQTEAIRELSTPVIEIWRGVLILPLIGLLDEARGQQITEQLLAAVVRNGASTVILDITGVPEIDTSVANYLLEAMAATRMLGTDSILTGVSPANAQTLVRITSYNVCYTKLLRPRKKAKWKIGRNLA